MPLKNRTSSLDIYQNVFVFSILLAILNPTYFEFLNSTLIQNKRNSKQSFLEEVQQIESKLFTWVFSL